MVSDSSDMTAQCLGAALLSLYAFDFRVFYRHTLQAAAAASVPMDIHVYTRVCEVYDVPVEPQVPQPILKGCVVNLKYQFSVLF